MQGILRLDRVNVLGVIGGVEEQKMIDGHALETPQLAPESNFAKRISPRGRPAVGL
jgi:hypothetical protein